MTKDEFDKLIPEQIVAVWRKNDGSGHPISFKAELTTIR